MKNQIDEQQNLQEQDLQKHNLQDCVGQNYAEQEGTAQGDGGYTHCLNCGEELKGNFCHKCGQAFCAAVPNVKDFLFEYANHEFIWDHNFLRTIKNLIVRPGFLSSEFQKGKFVSYTNPLKLNMFLLLIFVTIFLMFSDTEKVWKVVDDIAENDNKLSELVMSTITSDEMYQKAFEDSRRDTIVLRASRTLIDKYPDALNLVDDAPVQDATSTQFRVAVPDIMLEKGMIVKDDTGCYVFNNSSDYLKQTYYIDILSEMWNALLQFIGKYFPLIILLTVPFLSFAVRMVNRKQAMPRIHTFVFSLHYTAFLELLMIVIYIGFLLFPSLRAAMTWVFAILSFTYLTLAQRQFFEGTNWMKAGLKSLMVNLIYYSICLTVFFLIFFVIISVYVIKNINAFTVS